MKTGETCERGDRVADWLGGGQSVELTWVGFQVQLPAI